MHSSYGAQTHENWVGTVAYWDQPRPFPAFPHIPHERMLAPSLPPVPTHFGTLIHGAYSSDINMTPVRRSYSCSLQCIASAQTTEFILSSMVNGGGASCPAPLNLQSPIPLHGPWGALSVTLSLCVLT
eukprot:scaffold39939_cov30-Tisochrysis_lutea.AAC.10